MFERFVNVLLRWPGVGLCAALLLWCTAATVLWQFAEGVRPLNLDPSLGSLLPDRGPALARYEMVRKRFGDDDVLLVAWTSPDLFTAPALTRLKRFVGRLERVPGVVHVDSLAGAISAHGADGIIEIGGLLDTIPTTAAGLAALERDALANPLLRDNLLSANGQATLIAIQFDRALPGSTQFALVDRIASLSRLEAGPITQCLTGPAYARIEINRLLFHDLLRVLPFAIAATVLVAAIAMRTVRGLLLPLLATSGAVMCTMAVFLVAGHAFNFVTVIIAPVIFVLGFAYAIHFVTAFEDQLTLAANRAEAVRQALLEATGAITLNAALEVVGFLSLAFSSIEATRLFGLYAALGIVLAWLGAVVIVPTGLSLLPYRISRRGGRGDPSRFALPIARFDVRHRRAILIGGGVLAFIASVCATDLEVGTDYLRVLPRTHPIATDFHRVAAQFDGIVPVQILIESDIPGIFKDPRQLRTIAEFEAWLRAQPQVGKVVSLTDYLGVLYRAFVPDASADATIPPTRELTDQLLLLGAGNEVERFADSRFSAIVIHARSAAVATRDLATLVAHIEARLATLPPHMHGHVTGSSVLLVRSIGDITRGQIVSLAGTALTIYLVLTLIFGSFRVGALALLPNIVPIIVFFGILGLTGIALDVTTSLVAPIVLAIVIDDTVHFLLRFNSEARRAASEAAGVERAMAGTIRPVAFSTLGLLAGFLALSASELRNQAEFGLLAAAVMLIAWLLDLIFTPALASGMRFVTLWETLAVDLGCTEPQRTIALFRGLTARQARTAAILGSILSYKPGERILTHGVAANEILVVIEGVIAATVPHADGDTELRPPQRGELIGAASLFHGHHFANVDAVTEVRVLRLGEACLGRIQDRYPRIGAQIYRNLSAIMAERFADAAARI